MKTYVAKTEHRRPCDVCGTPILPGDRVVTWPHVAEELEHSNIMRLHETCNAIRNRLCIDEWHLGDAFNEDEDTQEEARRALDVSRLGTREEYLRRCEDFFLKEHFSRCSQTLVASFEASEAFRSAVIAHDEWSARRALEVKP